MAFTFSYLMAIADVTLVWLVATNGTRLIIPSGAGASIGIVASMYIHRKYVAKRKKYCE